MKRTTLAALAAALMLPFGLVACGGDDDGEDAAGATAAQTETAPADGAVSIESPAADLRLTLDRLLAEHALLATFAMQKGLDGREDFDAIAEALDGNTVDLGEAIASVYGEEAETSFLKLWRDHIGFFVDYTVATAKEDEAGQKAARDKLAGYQAEFSAFLDTATGGELPQSGAADALQAHVNQLVEAIETYAAGDYPTAYGQIREAYHHMFMTGDALSGAIVAQKPDMFALEPATASAADLRVTLGRLLAEHAGLATFAMQKGLDGREDFDAIAEALDGNTVDLGEAIASVYGEEAETSFLKLWRDHIGFFVDYTVATAKEDEAGQKAARDKLAGYRAEFSAFLDTATGGELPQSGAADALQAHVNQLVEAIETYAAGDYPTAYGQIREAYHHMFMTGDALSGAIVAQKPDMFALEPATASAADLRVTLGRLLAEHAGLATFAMQKGLDGREDFDAIAEALDGNTVDLGEAIASVYGEEAETSFLKLWRDHIGFFVDYTVATAKEDEAGQKAARDKLAGYRAEFSAFLDTATGGELPQSGAADALQAHVNQLVEAIESYAAGDYPTAYGQIREAYHHMFMTGDALSGAIVAQKPEGFAS